MAVMLWAQAAVSPRLLQSHAGCHQPRAVPTLSPSPCCQLLCGLTCPTVGSTPSFHAGLCQRQPRLVWCWAQLPSLGLSFPTALPSSPRYWCLEAGGPSMMVVVGTHAAAPRSPRGPILGWWMAELCHGCGAGKPSPWTPGDVWLHHPLSCGAFPLPDVSQTLAHPLLQDGAGAGGHEPAQLPACSACGHVPRLGQSCP